MPHSNLAVDVSEAVNLDGSHHISMWVFRPQNLDGSPVKMLFCLPGGSNNKAYWHPGAPLVAPGDGGRQPPAARSGTVEPLARANRVWGK
jgi:hypothetical protein